MNISRTLTCDNFISVYDTDKCYIPLERSQSVDIKKCLNFEKYLIFGKVTAGFVSAYGNHDNFVTVYITDMCSIALERSRREDVKKCLNFEKY